MPVPQLDHTVDFVPLERSLAASLPGRPLSGRLFDDELRRLLRSRLILVHLLSLAYVVLIVTFGLLMSRLESGSWRFDLYLAQNPHTLILAQSVVGALLLWRSRAMSIRSLRLWELFHFTTLAVCYGYLRFWRLAFIAGGSPDPSALNVGAQGAFTIFGYITTILAYGVLIPNTLRRSLIVVAALTAAPFAASVAAAVASPALWGDHFIRLMLQALANLVFPAGIAVFAAARAAALQRRAFEAERRAEQIGQYTLKQKLGEGGMGEVWLAEHALLKRPCAVKFIRPDLAASPATAARFAREVQAVTGLTHVNTVRVYDYGRTDDGSFYYVMEYLDGPTLEEFVQKNGPLLPGRVVYLLRQVCGALVEAHAAGLVHRDLKPGNVMVATLGGQRDVAKLLDFGLVQDLSADADDRLTRAGTVLGTPAYMSPEQAAGESAVDSRGDIYSLGAVAFFALTGRPPFQGKSVGQVLAAHRSEPAPPLIDFRPDAPADLAAVVARCLAKEPADRFQSAADLDLALGQCRCVADWSAERAAEWWQGRTGDGKLSRPNKRMQVTGPA
jgi:serine/threonine-protein kinase